MNIKRLNCDFGNSTNNFMIDGYYLEIPTNVVEISEEKANELFVSSIEAPEELLERLAISTEIEGQKKFFLVGEMAELSGLSNNHVSMMHNKIKSIIPMASFLGAIAYYNAINISEDKDNEIIIDNMNMMLPIWLLKNEPKFSIAQNNMADRFKGEHNVTVITPGMERTLKISINNTKCRIESEVARHSLNYKLLSNEKDKSTIMIEPRELVQFAKFNTVLVDIGGGSTDAVKLGKGLKSPESRESFQVIDIQPFLGRLEQLRKEKLLEYFHDLRALENFVVQNYAQKKYILKDENTGEIYDFTEKINSFLQEYADILVQKLLTAFIPEGNEVIKFIYFGGEAPILEPFIKESLLNHMNENASENNHFFLNKLIEEDKKEKFPPDSRTINLTALEILSINEMSSQK